MKVEADMSAAAARMTPNMNSTTGDVIGSNEDGGLGDVAQAGARAGINALTGDKIGVIRALASGASALGRVASQDANAATRNAFGDYLYADPAKTADALASRATIRNALVPGAGSVVPRSISALQNAMAIMAAHRGDNADQPNQ